MGSEDISIKGIGGGLWADPLDGDLLGFHVEYGGRAPESVRKLRNRSRKLGYRTKTTRKNRVQRLDVAAQSLDLLAKEIGFICIEFARMQYGNIVSKRVQVKKEFVEKVVQAAE